MEQRDRHRHRRRVTAAAAVPSPGTTRQERQWTLSRLGTAPHGAAALPPSPPGSSGGAGRRRRSRAGKVTGSDTGSGTGTMLRPRAAALVSLMRAAGDGRRYPDVSGGARVPSLCSAPPPQPVIAAKEPFPVELQEGKTYGWCACGHSKRQPFCDGSHKKEAPGLSSLRFTPTRTGPALLCGCKRTRSPPYCDGSHREDAVQAAPLHPRA
ncbi:CDGSH iron-sulfur domain-containing protein 3, mitochondrial [Agelaius phoeniceus]|uniref:CDGSH iron-sulfur domain-containing protein 3, mitochondrial n=1 Tax=Agelaius phoeniceus TaxID=39638 RepID=UPI004054F0A0